MNEHMKILVTGCLGQLGRAMKEAASGSGHTFIYTDVLETDGAVALDVTDPAAVKDFLDRHPVDVIVNCAGYTDVNRAEDEEDRARLLNADAVRILAAEARRNNALLVHISTDYVFDGLSGILLKEDAPVNPLSAYGRTKAEGEKAALESGCRSIIIRTAWLYSTGGRNFVRSILDKAASVPVLKVVCDQIGTPTFAPDLAEAIMTIIDSGRTDAAGIYHFSGEGVCSWYDFAREICDMSGCLCEVLPCMSDEYPSKVVRPHFSVLDKSLIKKTFGVNVPYWKDSLAFCLKKMTEEGLSF